MTDGPWRWKTLREVLVTGGAVVVSFGNTELPSNPFVVHGIVGRCLEGVTCVDFDARTSLLGFVGESYMNVYNI